MMNRTIVLCAIVLLSALVIAGCSGKQPDISQPEVVLTEEQAGESPAAEEPPAVVAPPVDAEAPPEQDPMVEALRTSMKEKQNKFAMSVTDFTLRKNEELELYFGVRNEKKEAYDFGVEFFCHEADISSANPKTDVTFKHEKRITALGPQGITILPLTITMADTAKPTEYRCLANISTNAPDVIGGKYVSKAFVITVPNP